MAEIVQQLVLRDEIWTCPGCDAQLHSADLVGTAAESVIYHDGTCTEMAKGYDAVRAGFDEALKRFEHTAAAAQAKAVEVAVAAERERLFTAFRHSTYGALDPAARGTALDLLCGLMSPTTPGEMGDGDGR